jgi:hypothetical protein
VSLDAALREWPESEKGSMDSMKWDARARSVLERLEGAATASIEGPLADEDLLAAPLGQSVEDGHNSRSPQSGGAEFPVPREGERMTMPVDRERDRRSLQDLAKMAQMTPPPASVSAPRSSGGLREQRERDSSRTGEAKGEDSGLIDLAAVAAASEPQLPSAPAPVGAAPAQLASAGLFDDEPNSVRPPPMSAAQPIPTMPPMPAASVAPASTSAPISAAAIAPVAHANHVNQASHANQAEAGSEPAKKSGKLVAIVFGAVALAAAAAGTFVVMSGHQAKQEAAVAMADKPAPARTAEAAPAKAPEPTPTAEAAPATADNAMDLSALPAASAAAKAAQAAPRSWSAKPATAAAKPEAKDDAKVASKDLPPPATGPVGALGDEMRKAVGANDAVPAAGPAGASGPAAGSVPQKPSQGAITGALGAVLPEARRCLGPDDAISRASVVFGSNGTVQNVNVSGGAAGKPAEACIKGALLKAKVAPFAEATYSAPVTIRH